MGLFQQRILRTPLCPSLRKLTEPAAANKAVPSDIALELVPRTYGDKAWVLEAEQNPLIRTTLKPNQPIRPLLLLLQQKWLLPSQRLARTQAGSGEGTVALPEITLLPDKSVTLSACLVKSGKAAPLAGVSWEKWLERSAAPAAPSTPAPAPLPRSSAEDTDSMDSTDGRSSQA